MAHTSLDSLKTRAKLLQKAKRKSGNPDFALKDAYSIIAKSQGFASWTELKKSLESAEKFNPHHWSAIWKVWFSSYEEAFSELNERTYLIPYRKHFFLCQSDYLKALGLEENDPDLLKVGNDFFKPKDKEALLRVMEKIKREC